MLRIRLVRTGKKNAPAFRVRVGSEVLGYFNPQPSPPQFSLDKKRIDYWIKRGAKLSPAVEKLIKGKYEFKPYRPKKAQAKETPAPPEGGVSKDAPPTEELVSSPARK